MSVCADIIIPIKPLACVSFIVEVVGEVTYHSFNVIAILDNVSGEIFFCIPLTAVASLEVVSRICKDHTHQYQDAFKAKNSPYQHLAFMDSIETILYILFSAFHSPAYTLYDET